MAEWCMAHPWMTFWLVALAFVVIDNALANLFVRGQEVKSCADAVHVVRCKNCKHWRPIHEHIPHMECNIFCGAYDHGYPTNADDYCSYAERKDGADVKDT